jgi:hypothetical protein
MKNVAFWDIKTQFVLHRRHITSPLQSQVVLTEVTRKNAIYWDVTPCGSCENRRFEGTISTIIRMTRFGELGKTLAVGSNRSMLQRITANVPISPIIDTLIMEVIRRFLQDLHSVTSQKTQFF